MTPIAITDAPPGLALADGTAWQIVPGDEPASGVVSHLTEVMQLGTSSGHARRLLVLTLPEPDTDGAVLADRDARSGRASSTVTCRVSSSETDQQFRQIAAVFCSEAQARGGLLLHGALAEWRGTCVVLAGPWGRGKTTASLRLKPPWRSLSDDASLVVRDGQGLFWAHPWPTWSRFLSGQPGGSWEVPRALPLAAIFFMLKAPEVHVERSGVGHGVGLLSESSEQAWRLMLQGMGADEVRELRLQRFENACQLAQRVPCYLLQLNLTDAFWQAIEEVLPNDADLRPR